MGSGLFWGWGWLALIGVVIILGVLLLPWFFFLLNLQALLGNIDPPNRRISPGKVWLNFIPVFHLAWFIYTVIKVRESLEAEFRARQWLVDGDLGYNVGLTAGILWIAAFFIGWIPFFGWVLALAGIICWVIYWLRTAEFKNRLDAGPAWNPRYGPMPGPGFSPYVMRYPQGYVPPGPTPPAPVTSSEGAVPGTEEGVEASVSAGMSAEEGLPVEGEAATQPAERRRSERRGRERRRRSRRADDSGAPPPPDDGGDTHCRACGAEHQRGDWYCSKCGSRLF